MRSEDNALIRFSRPRRLSVRGGQICVAAQ